jgi:beta-N-acetylhexosaminidase
MGAGTQSLGKLLFIGLEETRWTASCERLLRRYRPGGVILTEGNLRSPEQTAEMLAKIARTLDIMPFLAIEEEGGTVDPLRAFFPPLPSPQRVAAKGPEKVERLGSLMGEALALLGFNLNLAPRLDLASPLVKPSLEPQSFGANARSVAQCGQAFVAGLRRHRVLACGKHFPGLGALEFSTDPIVDKPMATLWREDLLPFRQSLPQLTMVKLSYLAYKAYDFDVAVQASLSKNVLEGLLRVKLGYRGVAVANCFEAVMEMRRAHPSAATGDEHYSVALDMEAFTKSVMAGCDMQVVRWRGKLLDLIGKALKKALNAGTPSTRRVDEALKRIRRAKKGLRPPSGKFSKREFDRLCRQFEDFTKECGAKE